MRRQGGWNFGLAIRAPSTGFFYRGNSRKVGEELAVVDPNVRSVVLDGDKVGGCLGLGELEVANDDVLAPGDEINVKQFLDGQWKDQDVLFDAESSSSETIDASSIGTENGLLNKCQIAMGQLLVGKDSQCWIRRQPLSRRP